ncbi:hypothetical protein [Brevibacillus reuszeri]|uniref:hypothetical protein n=1 Tax=Brevibacillus reuszeri TaxID=54915 RepID=UPI003D1A6ED7
MVMKSALTPLILAVSIGLTGLMTPSALANNVSTQNVQSQASIEHMRRKIIDSTYVALYEEWFNPATGLQRYDSYYIPSSGEKNTVEKKSFQLKPEESLYKATIKRFQDIYVWKPFAIVQIDGKKVEKRRASVTPKGNPVYEIAYIDLSTGLPIKEEHYDDKNQVMTTIVYFFDHVNDPNGDIFNHKDTTTKK